MVVEGHGMRVDFSESKDRPPQVFRLDPGGSMWVPNGYVGLAVPLGSYEVPLKLLPEDEDTEWNPGQILCYMGKAIQVNYRRAYFFLTLFKVEAI